MRLVFAGTPAPAVPTLRALAGGAHELVGAVTRTDAPHGRKRVLTPSPVAQAATELGMPVVKADRLDETATAAIAALRPELGVIVAYGGLVRGPLLSLPRGGWINLHFSLLPRWRGAAPVQRALIAGDRTLGASVFGLVPALDAGDVYATLSYSPGPEETAGDVLNALAHRGAGLVAEVVDAIAAGTAQAVPQQGEASYAPKLSVVDGALEVTAPAREVVDRFRGTTPEPGAHLVVDGQRLKVLEAGYGPGSAPVADAGALSFAGGEVLLQVADGTVVLRRVQPAGRAAMAAADWWRGLRGAAPRAASHPAAEAGA